MKTQIFLLVILFSLFISCQQEKELDDPEVLKQVLFDYFDGIDNKDLDKMNDVTTKDFILYEDGKVWNNDSLYNMLNTFPNAIAIYKLDNFNINIDSEIGNMFYYNHMDLTLNDTTQMVFDFIESATFKKVEGKWKMNFLHSTVTK